MTNVLHISANTYPPLNDRNHHTKQIWKELSKGFDEYHIIARSENNSSSYSIEGNIHLHLVPKLTSKSKIFFISSFAMFGIIKKYKISHLLAQCPIIGGFTAVLASKIFKIPLLVEINGRDYIRWDKNNSLFGIIKFIQNFVFKNCNKIRYPNKDIKNFLCSKNLKNITFIPHRVKHDLFKKQKKDFVINKSTIKIVSIGRFVWEKDYLFLIDSLASLEIPVELTLIGGGPDSNKYVEKNKNNKRIKLILIDWIEQKEMIELVINNDLYIQSSISETGPRTILEAMAMKMPILSSNVGLFPDIVNKYNCGFMYKAHDKCDFLDKLNVLIESENIRSEIANNAYDTSRELYDWEKVFELYRNEIKSMNYENT